MEEVLSRTMFCPYCNANNRPKKGNIFIVWGYDRKKLYIRKAHQDGISGFTPHILCFDKSIATLNGIYFEYSCGMNGCGIEIGELYEDGTQKITFLRTDSFTLPLLHAIPLISHWRNTGYELI